MNSAAAPNERQVKAIVDGVQERLLTLGAKPIRREGEREGRWVLLDFADVVVHVQHSEERTYYALERLWKDCPELPLPESVVHRPAAGQPGDRSDPQDHLLEVLGRELSASPEGQADRNPIFACVPSQKGLLALPPQRHR